MSEIKNVESLSNQQQPIGAHVPASGPQTTHGHKPGVLAGEKDRAPEFSAETLPAGTAPASRTFKPNPTDEAPTTNHDANDSYDKEDPSAQRHRAQDTIGGATSADVHTGLGKPVQGQSSNELRHDGVGAGNKQTAGLEGVGAQAPAQKDGSTGTVNPHDTGMAGQRGLDREEAAGQGDRGNTVSTNAEDRVPEGAGAAVANAKR